MSKNILPYSMRYVMKLTTTNMRRCIDVSITRTSSRLKDFEPNSEKWYEVLNTIHALDKLKKVLDDFQFHNSLLYRKEKADDPEQRIKTPQASQN